MLESSILCNVLLLRQSLLQIKCWILNTEFTHCLRNKLLRWHLQQGHWYCQKKFTWTVFMHTFGTAKFVSTWSLIWSRHAEALWILCLRPYCIATQSNRYILTICKLRGCISFDCYVLIDNKVYSLGRICLYYEQLSITRPFLIFVYICILHPWKYMHLFSKALPFNSMPLVNDILLLNK